MQVSLPLCMVACRAVHIDHLPIPMRASARTASQHSPRTVPTLMQQSRKVRYISEGEMQELLCASGKAQGMDPARAMMLAAVGRNIYGIGSVYPAETVAELQKLCVVPARQGEPWALLMINCLRGKLPRLRSESTASARMAAAKRAANARRSKT